MNRTLRVGIANYAEMKARTMAIARGELRSDGDSPKIWFTSMDSLARILSDSNRELLAIIRTQEPKSITELASLSGRARSNLSRTLRTMERYGLVALEKTDGRELLPSVPYDDVQLDLPIVPRLAA